MGDLYSQCTSDGTYAFRSEVPEEQVIIARKALSWIPKAVYWLIATTFAAVLLPTFIYVAYAEGAENVAAQLYVVSVLVAICVSALAYKQFARALLLRTHLILMGKAVIFPPFNTVTAFYNEQAERLKYVPDPARVHELRDMLIEKSLRMLQLHFLINQLVQEGEGPGDEKYEMVDDQSIAIQEEVAETIASFIRGEPL